MLGAFKFKPQLLTLEGRSLPGTVLSAVDPSVALTLGTALTSILDIQEPAMRVAVPGVTANNPDGTGSATNEPSSVMPVAAGQAVSLPGADLGAPISDPLSQNILDDIHVVNGLSGQSSHHINNQGGTIVQIGFLPGSFIQVSGQNAITFGADPPTDGWDNVLIDGSGNVFGAQGDFHLPPAHVTSSGFDFFAGLVASSDLSGTYDNVGGNATFQVMMQLHVTSPNAPGFNNDTCFNDITQINFDSGNPNGVLFSTDPNNPREIGTVEDNTFPANAFAVGSCGSFLGIDYAGLINGQFGLPQASGNDFVLSLSLTPPPGP